MSARASRRAAQFDFSSLSNIERLLIAQAAHEYGAAQGSWSTTSKLMAKHALVSRPKNFFTPTLCSSIYDHLLNDAGLERTEAAGSPKAPENLALARKHFQLRFEELADLIKVEETKFRAVMQEIEEIKAGHWDSSLKARLSGTPTSAVERGASEDASETVADDEDAEAVSGVEDGDGEVEEPEEDDARDEDAPPLVEEEAMSEADDEEVDGGIDEAEEPLDANSEANESASEDGEASKQTEDEPEEQNESSEDEPLQTVRRSTRRKSSAASTAPPLSMRGRGRRQRPVKEEAGSEGESDAEAEADPSDEAAQAEEEVPSSPGAPRTRDGKRKAAFTDDARDAKRAREDSELPDEEEETTTNTRASGRKGAHKVISPPGPATAAEGLPNKKFQNVIGLLHQQISTHRNGTIFQHPIKTGDAPDYHDIVKRPMDLKTIKQRVKDGAISNSLEFQRDVYLMFANAMMYNRPGSDVYAMAEDMMYDSELAIKNHKQTEGFRAQR